MKYLLLCVVLFAYVEAADLPSYIDECRVNNVPCFLSEARRVVQNVLLGDVKYNLPCYIPYRQSEAIMLDNENGTFNLHVVRLWGLDTVSIKYMNVNFHAGIAMASYYFLRLRLQFSYEINIIGTPLHGFGSGEIVLDEVFLSHIFRFIIDPDRYAFVYDPSVVLSTVNIVYDLKNLNNEAKNYLKKNYEYLNKLFQPGLRRFLNDVVLSPSIYLLKSIKITDGIDFKDTNYQYIE